MKKVKAEKPAPVEAPVGETEPPPVAVKAVKTKAPKAPKEKKEVRLCGVYAISTATVSVQRTLRWRWALAEAIRRPHGLTARVAEQNCFECIAASTKFDTMRGSDPAKLLQSLCVLIGTVWLVGYPAFQTESFESTR